MKKTWTFVFVAVVVGTLTACGNGDKTNSFPSVSSGNTSVLTEKTYTIHYDLGGLPGATISTLGQEVTSGESFELAIPKADGYIFEKWTDSAQMEIVSGIYDYECDLYLTAVWQKDESGNGWSERI